MAVSPQICNIVLPLLIAIPLVVAVADDVLTVPAPSIAIPLIPLPSPLPAPAPLPAPSPPPTPVIPPFYGPSLAPTTPTPLVPAPPPQIIVPAPLPQSIVPAPLPQIIVPDDALQFTITFNLTLDNYTSIEVEEGLADDTNNSKNIFQFALEAEILILFPGLAPRYKVVNVRRDIVVDMAIFVDVGHRLSAEDLYVLFREKIERGGRGVVEELEILSAVMSIVCTKNCPIGIEEPLLEEEQLEEVEISPAQVPGPVPTPEVGQVPTPEIIATQEPAPTSSTAKDRGLSDGAIAGIVIGTFIGVAILSGFIIWRERTSRPPGAAAEVAAGPKIGGVHSTRAIVPETDLEMSPLETGPS